MQKVNLRDFSIGNVFVPHEVGLVGGVALRLAKIRGEYRWHRHNKEDEFFLVVKGQIFIDTDQESVRLKEWEGYLVPAGTRHRSRSEEEATVLMIEPKETKTQGEW
jgi:mannose-6-phosphate isomerase-like protein (cupin superfamily)